MDSQMTEYVLLVIGDGMYDLVHLLEYAPDVLEIQDADVLHSGTQVSTQSPELTNQARITGDEGSLEGSDDVPTWRHVVDEEIEYTFITLIGIHFEQ